MVQTAKEQISVPRADEVGPGLRFLLASGSARRRDIMRLAGLHGVIQPASGSRREEDAINGDHASDMTRRNALIKLNAALSACGNRLPWNCVVMAADTLVSLDGETLGKPSDHDEARETLLRLRGRAHEVATTVAVTYAQHRQLGVKMTHTVVSNVLMRSYSIAEVERYIAGGTPFDRAGSYGVQDVEFNPAESVSGCYLNVIGMPLCALSSLLPSDACYFRSSHIYLTCLAHESGATD